MGELSQAMRMLSGSKFPTCIQKVDYPIHKGQPNPAHGTYYFVGSIPGECCELTDPMGQMKSKHYATEPEAIAAAVAAGATRIQRADCSFVKIEQETTMNHHVSEKEMQDAIQTGSKIIAHLEKIGDRKPGADNEINYPRNKPAAAEAKTDTYAPIHAVNLASVPVMTTDRCIPRKQQAALARKLFKRLGIKGMSVTTPNYSMASIVEVVLPHEDHPGWAGFEEWQNQCWSDIPDNVPAKARMLARWEAKNKVEAILNAAFPNHDDRSDSQSDYFDRCWSVN